MPLTIEDAVKQLSAQLDARGKFNPGNLLDSFIGVATINSSGLQQMLDGLMKKTGILSDQDEAAMQELLKQQEEERKKRQAVRIKNAIFIISAITVTAGVVYLAVRKK